MPYMKNLQNLLYNWIKNDIWFSVNDVQNGLVIHRRVRIAVTDFLAGYVLLPAIPSFAYRLVDVTLVSEGGAAGGSTTLDIVGTLSGASRKLLAVAVAALTQSAVVRAGAANATVLADGATFTRNDVNTPIVLGVTGAALSGSTFIDVMLAYIVEHE